MATDYPSQVYNHFGKAVTRLFTKMT